VSTAIENLKAAQQRAESGRPKAGGFPFLAETLRRAGVSRTVWSLPGCESLYLTLGGPVMVLGTPLASGAIDVPRFDRDALITALRRDQSGDSTFREFLGAAWNAGVLRYEVDLDEREVTYSGCNGETFVESYPTVEVK
jgi:uncharacterized protein YbcV (DUF1398 family)